MTKKPKTVRDPFPKHDREVCGARSLAECAKDRARAIRKGKALLARMKGQGWKLEVWENLGWHYRVYAGPLSVSEKRDRSPEFRYSAMMSERPDDHIGGSYAWYGDTHSSDPNRTARKQLEIAEAALARLSECVAIARRAVGSRRIGKG